MTARASVCLSSVGLLTLAALLLFTRDIGNNHSSFPFHQKSYIPLWSGKVRTRDNSFASSFNRTCECLPLTMLDEPRPAVILASFPGSGSTWTRYLLQTATGIGTGSLSNDNELQHSGFPFEHTKPWERLLVVKDHNGAMRGEFKRAILIIRNPYDALLAFFNYEFSQNKKHVAVAPSHEFRTVWPRFVLEQATYWERQVMFYSGSFPGPVLPVLYENLKTNMMGELSRMLTFLNQTHQADRIACLLNDREGKFYRRNVSAVIPSNLYSNELVEHVNKCIDHVSSPVRSYHGTDLSFYKRPAIDK